MISMDIRMDIHVHGTPGYISKTVIFTIEGEYKVVCALSNSAAFDDLEWPRTQVSRSQYSLRRVSHKRCIRYTPCLFLH